MSYNSEVLADSPVRYWKLDDSTGVDTQGNGNLTKGSGTNAPTTGQAGQSGIGSSWYFDGGDFASFAMPSLSTTMTFEMFFKSDAANKGSHTFMRFDGASVGVIRMQGDGAVYAGEIYGVMGGAEFRSNTRYDDNNWHHLAVVVNGTSVKVYVDKVLKSDLTNGSASYSFGPTGYLGRDMANTANEYLIGGLDEVAIYNTALSPTRIAAHYDARAIVPTANAAFTATPATGAGTAQDATVDLSAIKPLFTDTFTGTAGSPWSANWTTFNTFNYGYINLDGTGRGRLGYTSISDQAGAWATSVQGGQDVGLVYTFTNGGADNWNGLVNGSVSLPGSGNLLFTNALVLTPTSSVTYLEVWVNGVRVSELNTGLGNLSGKRVKMVAEGGTVKVKTWTVGAQEPEAWGYEATVTDLDVEWKAFFSISNKDVGGTGVAYLDDVEMYEIVDAYANVSVSAAAATGSAEMLDVGEYPAGTTGVNVSAVAAEGAGIAGNAAPLITSAVTHYATDDGKEWADGSGNGSGYIGNGTSYPRWLIKVPAEAPSGSGVVSATLNVYIGVGTYPNPVSVQRVTSAWSTDLLGNTQGSPTIDPQVYSSLSITSKGWKSIDITALAQDWESGIPNHGLALKGNEYFLIAESLRNGKTPYVTVEYGDNLNATVRPEPATASGLFQIREVFTGTPEIYNSWIDMNARRSDTPGPEHTFSWEPFIQISNNGAGIAVEASQLHKSRFDFPFDRSLGRARLLLRLIRPPHWEPAAPPGATTTLTVRLITTPWDWDDTTSITAETIGPVISVQDVLVEGEEYRELDVTDAVYMWMHGVPNHGVYVTTSGYSMVYYSLAFPGDERPEDPSNSAWQDRTWPRILMEAYDTGDVQVRTYPIRGSGLMRDGKLPQPNVTVPAERAQAFSTMPGGLFTSPAIITPNAITGDGIVNDVTLTLDVNGLAEPKPFVGTSYAVDPDEARQDKDDPYFRRIVATTDSDDIWFRLDEKSGLDVVQRVGGSGAVIPVTDNPQAKWNIEPQFSINGPGGRRAVRLDGRQYIDRSVNTSMFPMPVQILNAGEEYTFETVIRTTQKDFLLFSAHDVGDRTFSNRLWVKGGKITLTGPPASVTSSTDSEVSGFKDIADGQWHHIVVTYDAKGPENDLNNGLRIYIDGQLDIRKRDVQTRIFATPDHWFGAPTGMRNWLNLPPNFIGDVMEMTYRYRMDLGRHDIQRLYYDAMGIIPIEAAPFRGTGEMLDAKGKGNRKRILMLYFDTSNPYDASRTTQERYTGGSWMSYPGDFDFGVQIPTPGERAYYDTWSDNRFEGHLTVLGMKVFYQTLDRVGFDYFRDPVTDLPRLLDLEHDIDVTDYDIIIYKNWPDEGANELDRIKDIYGTTEVLDEHLDSLRRVIDKHGISVWISNPTLAVKMGVISTAEVVSTMIDRAPSSGELARVNSSPIPPQYGLNQVNKYEDHGPHVDPWWFDENGESTAPDGMGGHGIGRYDTYRNNRERIVATVPGMTDALPWRFIEDYQIWSRFNHMSLDLDFQYKLGDRRNKVDQNGNITEAGGMRLGDEYVSPHLFQTDLSIHYTAGTTRAQFRTETYGAPPGAVMAGTVVTKFGANVWVNGNVQIPNPYADYAGTIVVQPGDALKGKPVGGKILVTLSNDPSYAIHGSLDWVGTGDGGYGGDDNFHMQDIPEEAELIERFGDTQGETQWTREWQYSTRRWSVGWDPRGRTSDGGGGEVQAYQNADGTVSYRTNNGGGGFGGGGLAPLLIGEKYNLIDTKVFTIVKAGIKWLQQRQPYVPGARTIRVLDLEGSGEMPQPTVNAGRSVQVIVPDAGLGNAQMRTPDGYDEDVVILAFPAVGSAVINNYVRFVVVLPAYGYGSMSTVGDVTAGKEGITLFLYRPDSINLYLEEL